MSAGIKTTTMARQLADFLSGLYGQSIGQVTENAIVAYAAGLSDAKDARGIALAAYLKAGGPTMTDDKTAKSGSIGKAADDLRAAAAKRDAKRAKR